MRLKHPACTTLYRTTISASSARERRCRSAAPHTVRPPAARQRHRRAPRPSRRACVPCIRRWTKILRTFTAADSKELLEGIDSGELLRRITETTTNGSIRQSDLTQALDRVDRLETKIGVRPPVLTYDRDRRRLFLADRSFFFYRQYGDPQWPWDSDERLNAAISQAPEEPQLDLALEIPLSNWTGAEAGDRSRDATPEQPAVEPA